MSGTKALYRNKIDNVAKFFEDKYSDEKNIDYMIYNLCSEMEYDHRKFHGNVKRFKVTSCLFVLWMDDMFFKIDDHNVPTIEQMFELVDDVKDWLHGGDGRERVVALHCKGGKGRTGTMICAVLINNGLFKVIITDRSNKISRLGKLGGCHNPIIFKFFCCSSCC